MAKKLKLFVSPKKLLILVFFTIIFGFLYIGYISKTQSVDSLSVAILELYIVILSIVFIGVTFIGYTTLKEEAIRIAKKEAGKIAKEEVERILKPYTKLFDETSATIERTLKENAASSQKLKEIVAKSTESTKDEGYNIK